MNKLFVLTIILIYSTSCYSIESSFYGEAYNPKDGTLLYVERHEITLDDSGNYASARVSYADESGKVFAMKNLNYLKGALFPDFSFKDDRTGTVINVERHKKVVEVSYKSQKESFNKSVKIVKNLVIDAGFDQLLIKKWTELLRSEPLVFQFLVPTRAESIGFELKPIYQDDSIIRLILSVDNFFVSLILDPITLTYEKSTKRILRYQGLTNIEEIKKGEITGENYVADIKYYYTEGSE